MAGLTGNQEGNLAGSTLSMERALGNLRQWTGASLAEELVAFTENPARQACFQ
jgi:N-acetylglucosamine-6-phosphate deacetylase